MSFFNTMRGALKQPSRQQAQYYQPQAQQPPQQAQQPQWSGQPQVNWGNSMQADPRMQEQMARAQALRQQQMNNPQMDAWKQKMQAQNQQIGAPDPNTYMSSSQQQLLANLMKNQQYKNRPEYAAQVNMLKGNAKNEYDQRMAYMDYQRQREKANQNNEGAGSYTMFNLLRRGGRGNFNQAGYEQWKDRGMPLNAAAEGEYLAKHPQQSQRWMPFSFKMFGNQNG